jgi:hypothetical protein
MAAAQLQHDHGNWLVMWGCYTHTYVAFPLFHAPRGTVLIATAPGEMAAKMRRQERSARKPAPGSPQQWLEPGEPAKGGPAPGGPLGWPTAGGSPGWPGRESLPRTG